MCPRISNNVPTRCRCAQAATRPFGQPTHHIGRTGYPGRIGCWLCWRITSKTLDRSASTSQCRVPRHLPLRTPRHWLRSPQRPFPALVAPHQVSTFHRGGRACSPTSTSVFHPNEALVAAQHDDLRMLDPLRHPRDCGNEPVAIYDVQEEVRGDLRRLATDLPVDSIHRSAHMAGLRRLQIHAFADRGDSVAAGDKVYADLVHAAVTGLWSWVRD